MRDTDAPILSPLHPGVRASLERLGLVHEVVPCDPALADTADFCARYGYRPDESANALLIGGRKGEERRFALCVLLADSRLDVNRVVRKKLGVRRLSFASSEDTRRITGMELGGVTPFALPETLPIWIDARVAGCEHVVLGGGNRASKIVMAPAELLRVPYAELVTGLANPIAAD